MIRRLDFKIVFILLISVLAPLGVSAVLVFNAIDTSLGLGLNDELAKQLKGAVDIRRAHIQELKEGFQHTASHLVDSQKLFEAVAFGDDNAIREVLKDFFSANENLKFIRLTREADKGELTVASEKPLNTADARTISIGNDVELGPFSHVEAVFEVEGSLEKEFKHAGEILHTYQALVSAPPDYLKNRFILVYLAILSLAVIASILIGVFLARRIIRRIHHLSVATFKVAAGDLSFRVDSGAKDEVGELVEAFNEMVSELSQSRARIEYLQKISAWQEIARRLAHEIKNPLTPIQLAAQQLKEKYGGDDPKFKALLGQSVEIIKEEVETLRRLVTDFAAFAKLPKINPARVDLDDFMRECEASIGPSTEQTGVQIRFVQNAPSASVSIDRIMMKRVIDNLIRNAAESLSEQGSQNPMIQVIAVQKKTLGRKEVEISVHDNGPGVNEEYRTTLFDPYVTTKSEGTGLGLAISKKIVLEHGGRIWLDEKNENGATFVVALPAL